MRLDQYAQVYVPEWIKNVNAEPYFQYFANNPMQEHIAMEMDMRFKAHFWPPALEPFTELFGQQPEVEDGASLSSTSTPASSLVPSARSSPHKNGLLKELQRPDESWLQEPSSEAKALEEEDLDGALGHLSLEEEELEPTEPTVFSAGRQREVLLSMQNYQEKWTSLLDAELQYRATELASQAVYAAQIFRSSTSTGALYTSAHAAASNKGGYSDNGMAAAAQNFQRHLYYVKVPGIRQDKPNLSIHDRLQIRPIRREPTVNQYWAMQVYEAHITSVHKLSGTITFSCDPVAGGEFARYVHDPAYLFNIEFFPAQRHFQDAKKSLTVIGHILKQHCARAKLLQQWLFPSYLDGVDMTFRKVGEDDTEMHPELQKLNPEQAATAHLLATHAPHVPFLISGPPGTGKTRTLVGATLAILKNQPNARILLCAPSNTAADTLALRLKEHLSPSELFRMNHPTRSFAEVPQALGPYCFIESQAANGPFAAYGLPAWADLMQKRVVVTATFDVPLLISANCSNLHLTYLQAHLAKGFGALDVSTSHWTHLLVDEAGQGTEAEITSALVCMLPWHPTRENQPVIALCGDVAQLGPQIRSPLCRKGGLDCSLLDRLAEWPLYASAAHTIIQHVKRQRPVPPNTPCGQLIRNYRATHPMLLMLPSILFYNDILLPFASGSCRFTRDRRLPNPNLPIWFENVHGEDVSLDDGISWYNGDEIARIVDICTRLTRPNATEPVCQPTDIAVISPFNEQVWQIRIALRKCGLGEISVGPVEAFQGAEHPVSILSTVRSQAKHLAKDASDGIGIIHERKRLCVAISRAQELLIVVGNLSLLFHEDATWRQLLTIAARNQCLTGTPIDALTTKEQMDHHMGPISRLEMAMHEEVAYLKAHGSSSRENEEDDLQNDGDAIRRAALVAARSAAMALMDS